jgi:hypothetical protein
MRFILPSLLTVVVGTTSWCAAQMEEMPEPPVRQHEATTGAAHPVEHPIIPRHAEWAGLMVMFIIAMFVAAAAVGILAVDMNKVDEVPDDHAHDAHDSHGHGHQ